MLIEDHAAALPEDARRFVDQIAASTQHMSSLINDLLSLSRLGRQPIKEQPVSPADIARQAIAELNGTGGGKVAGIRIGDLPRCRADPGLLQQVYVNLLSNALKFSRNREDAVIEVGWRPDLDEPAYHTYFVKDNGAGFDIKYADKLFRVFQRLHFREDYEGTGVGLAIVQRVIHRHGGRVWAEGEVGKGATFYFTLARSDVA
jgi:light-regulated signal transduction histidine kinase (bacteriophytochrome)